MLWKKDVLFCEMNPAFYKISEQKEVAKRHIQDYFSSYRFATTRTEEELPNVVASHSSTLIKRGKGIDVTLQENKAVNIKLANAQMNGLIIHPGEVFSFCRTVGKMTKRRGYKAGRVLGADGLKPGLGGGLCNLANTIHRMVLHSPLYVIEFHSHSDALAPDGDKRVPFSSGTSVSYNNIDYRFINNTDQDVQLLLWCDEEKSHGELRSERPFKYLYRIVEEDHHFIKEGDDYYRISKIYKETYTRDTGEVIARQLVLDNRSLVMFDHSQIPMELVRE